MSQWLKGLLTGGIVAAVVTIVAAGAWSGVSRPAAAQFTRMPDGKPNLNGIWAANNTANWDIQTHQAKQGPVTALGAAFSVPGGMGVVEGGEIPYKPEALAQRDANARNWMANDPEVKCYLPGVPRATYMPYPVPDRAVDRAQRHPGDVRVRVGEPHRPHEHEPGEPDRRLDGMVERPLGGRHAGRGRDRASSIRRGSIGPATTTATPCTSSSATRRSGPT